jgi:hypothetical protein
MRIKPRLLNGALGFNYYLARVLTSAWFAIASRNKPILLVYQMGKVGSTSVERSLKAAGLEYAVFHIHVLTDRGIRWEEKWYYGNSPKLLRRSLWPKTKHLFASHYLKGRLKAGGREHNKPQVVTLVRDPIARNISSLFQNLDRYGPNLQGNSSDETQPNKTPNSSITSHLTGYSDSFYPYPYDWFELECKEALGVDVLGCEFAKEKGYQIYRGDRADTLLLKLESLDESGPAAFKEFLGIENLPLVRSNEAMSKTYSSKYREFLQTVRLPVEYIENQYRNNPVDHFYTNAEIDAFRQRWMKSGGPGSQNGRN